MTIHEFQLKVKNYDIRKDFKTLYQSCMNAIESLSESDLLYLLDSRNNSPVGYINCFSLWSNENKIQIHSDNESTEVDPVITDIAPDHSRLQCIDFITITVKHEVNPKIFFSGYINVGLTEKYPNCLFATGNFKETLTHLFGDCLVSSKSNFKSFEEAVDKGYKEMDFEFEVSENWFLN